jgi:hypothetical protein
MMIGGSILVVAQNRVYESPNRDLRAVIVIGKQHQRRVEVRTSRGTLLQTKRLAPQIYSGGEAVGHAEWSSDGNFFVFNTYNLGGHQPWHVPTYFYCVKDKRIHSLDALVGLITSDFSLLGNTITTTRLKVGKEMANEPLTVTLPAIVPRRAEQIVGRERRERVL